MWRNTSTFFYILAFNYWIFMWHQTKKIIRATCNYRGSYFLLSLSLKRYALLILNPLYLLFVQLKWYHAVKNSTLGIFTVLKQKHAKNHCHLSSVVYLTLLLASSNTILDLGCHKISNYMPSLIGKFMSLIFKLVRFLDPSNQLSISQQFGFHLYSSYNKIVIKFCM